MTSRNMENPLAISVLVTFIAAGASLECEICQGIGHSCVGHMETCAPALDRCGILLGEIELGFLLMTIDKMCIASTSCEAYTDTVINMGKSGRLRNRLFCCVGDECRRINPIWTPMDTTPNGMVCPACFQVNEFECKKEEELQCTGNQDNCLLVTGTATRGGQVIPMTMKGCTNNAECRQLRDHSDTVSGINVILSYSCFPASGKGGAWVSEATRNISDSYGIFLSMLAGLFLVQFFL
ncbi:phospholipase A2 inhibitor gamma subunit B-like [Sceloporus undulatus]|uniref:phospholipase A2 inhibitor gamma subunit B-like n=1 Tax=Sceloporus undulatus TaxID=8520 RepID=UPI001C4BB63A|nr:phospholipase A2 inhibitor gamma subunit B-like [Sceloporus undulatus]